MSGMDLFDDIGGAFDVLDQLETWLSFAFASKSDSARGRRFNRLALVEIRIPRADKMQEQGKRPVNLRETSEYLSRFGVHNKCCGFSSTHMHFKVRRTQEKWARTLLDVDEDGIPRLDYGRKSWAEKAAVLKAEKRAKKRATEPSLFRDLMDVFFGGW
jgi:hypothetical protein